VESKKNVLTKLALFLVLAISPVEKLCAQSLAPRAYVITPEHANAITLTWSFYDGGLNFNGTIPITGATGTYYVPTFSYYHSFSFFGRSANFTKVEMITALDETFGTGHKEEKSAVLRQDTAEFLRSQVAAINVNNFIVRPNASM
jgi:hypothetical protein